MWGSKLDLTIKKGYYKSNQRFLASAIISPLISMYEVVISAFLFIVVLLNLQNLVFSWSQ